MNKPWYDEEVQDLVKYSEQRFEATIPCASEILHLNHFLFEMRVLFTKRDKAKLVVPMVEQSFLFRVFHIGQSRPWEIEVPEDAVWAFVPQVSKMLNDKCDYLAELCGYKRKED